MRRVLSNKPQLVQRFRFAFLNHAAFAGMNLPPRLIDQVNVFARRYRRQVIALAAQRRL